MFVTPAPLGPTAPGTQKGLDRELPVQPLRAGQSVLASGSKSAATAGISETDEFTVTNSPLAADSSAESITSSTW